MRSACVCARPGKDRYVYLSVVVPCYNEGEVIDQLIEALLPALDDIGREYEVILVDDGSTDDTLARMRTI